MKVVVERSKWANPSYDTPEDNHGPSELLNHRGCMCCLGFALQQCGVSPHDLLYTGTPEGIPPSSVLDLEPAQQRLIDTFVDLTGESNEDFSLRDTRLTVAAIGANDDRALTLEEREAKLREIFASYGHEIEFV